MRIQQLKLFFPLVIFLGCGTAFLPFFTTKAQTPDERTIMLSGRYHFGEGYGETREQAIAYARTDLIEKLVVVVASDSRMQVRETGEDVTGSFASQTRSISRMQLRGLDYLPLERRDGTWRVLAFISREDYLSSLESQEQRLKQIVTEAQRQERSGLYGRALRLYAQALVELQFHPLPVGIYAGPDQNERTNIDVYAENRIRSIYNDVSLSIGNLQVHSSPDEVLFELYAKLNGSPVDGTLAAIDRRGYGFTEFIDGSTRLFLDTLPQQLRTSYTILLRPAYTSNDDEFMEIAGKVLPSVRKRVEVDFSDQISIGFSAVRVGTGGYQFNPEIRNLAVTEISWELGDGTVTNRTNPRHAYEDPSKPYTIRMQVNRIPELIIEQELRADGRLYPVESRVQVAESSSGTATNRAAVPATQRSRQLPVEETNTPPETNTAESLPAPYTVPERHKPIVDDLIRVPDFEVAQTRLAQFNRSGLIRFGNADAVLDVVSSYAMVINPETRAVEAVLSPEESGYRTSLRTAQLIDNVSERYRGMPVVWIQMLR
ncbi:MAG: LPP20 family lipoprotein [Balneolales bacterium]|nr:LPP20 family lipoprotein [Balneolales bacterium]